MKLRGCFIIGALFLALCFFGSASLFKGYSPRQTVTFFLAPSPSELCTIGASITTALETYFQEHGQYPSSLVDAGIAPADTFFGPWNYRVHDDVGPIVGSVLISIVLGVPILILKI